MNLIELPMELLQNICIVVMHTSGIRNVVLLRRVCKTLDSLIQSIVFSLPTFENEDDETSGILSRDPAMDKRMVARLITTKLMTANSDERPLCLAIRVAAREVTNITGENAAPYFDLLASCAAHELHLDRIVSLLSPRRYYTTTEGDLLNDVLIAAILSEQENLVKDVIGRGAHPASQSKCFGLPLSIAARVGNKSIVNILLHDNLVKKSLGCGIAIQVAVKEGHIPIVDLLLDNRVPFEPSEIQRDGATVDREAEFWTNLTQTAIENNQEGLLRRCLDSRPELWQNELLQSLLEDACRFGNINIVRFLLSRCFPASLTGPLFWAAYNGNCAIIDMLLSYVLDPDSIFTALAAAYLRKDRRMLNHLLSLQHWSSRMPDPTQTFRDLVDAVFDPRSTSIDSKFDELEREYRTACGTGDLRCLRKILSSNYRSQAGFALAALGKHPAALSYLYETTAPLFSQDTILQAKSLAILQVYVTYGWDINAPYHRTSPSLLGQFITDQRVVAWFLDHGANPNAGCEWDITPMSLAVCKAPLSTINLLFRNGATPKKGQLLHWAIIRNDPDTIQIINTLLNFGAPINKIQYKDDRKSWNENHMCGMGTPLHTAVKYKQIETVSFLLDKGADQTIEDSLGRTPLQLAKNSGLRDIVHLLRTKLASTQRVESDPLIAS